MITHYVYHVVGRKVGCCKSLEEREKWYPKGTKLDILEELHDKTDKEAGDIEWQWADKFGYKRGNHYTIPLKAGQAPGALITRTYEQWLNAMTPQQRSDTVKKGHAARDPDWAKRLWDRLTPEERELRISKLARGDRVSDQIRDQQANLTPEQKARRIERAQKLAAGTKWINNGIALRRLPANEPIPEGWALGKKLR